MKYLLDTHVLIWALEDSPRLPQKIKDIICDDGNQIYISTVSLWEIGLTHKISPETMVYSSSQIRDYSCRAGYIFLSLGVDSVCQNETLDFNGHKDPFDQMLISQSVANQMRLITHDDKIKKLNIGFIEYF